MEKLPETEKINRFNFPEIERMEEPLIELINKLKTNLEVGKYQTLLSDDVGGRIPTLVIAEILKNIGGNNFSVRFIAAGHSTPEKSNTEEWETLVNYISKNIPPAENLLLITQFIHYGNTISKLLNALDRNGFKNVDIAAVRSLYPEDILSAQFDAHTFIGDRSSTMDIDSKHNFYTGIAKRMKEYDPSPQLLTSIISKEGRERFMHEEIDQIYDLKPDDRADVINAKFKDPARNAIFEARVKEPLSEKEKEQIQENIVKTREDVKTLANIILKQVWGKEVEKGL